MDVHADRYAMISRLENPAERPGAIAELLKLPEGEVARAIDALRQPAGAPSDLAQISDDDVLVLRIARSVDLDFDHTRAFVVGLRTGKPIMRLALDVGILYDKARRIGQLLGWDRSWVKKGAEPVAGPAPVAAAPRPSERGLLRCRERDEKNRQLLELWRSGVELTTIAERMDWAVETLLGRVRILRRIHGETVVPVRAAVREELYEVPVRHLPNVQPLLPTPPVSAAAGAPLLPDHRGIAEVAVAIGISPGVLRIWERRHGWPRSERARGRSCRVYSPLMVEQLERVAELIRRGKAIGRIIRDGEPSLDEVATPPSGSSRSVAQPSPVGIG